MATTWKQTNSVLRGDQLTFEIQEVVNLIDGDKFSVTAHKSAAEAVFKKLLKDKILASRSKVTNEKTFETKVNLSSFETYLTS